MEMTLPEWNNKMETSSSKEEEALSEDNVELFKRVVAKCDQLPLFIKKLREFQKSVKAAQDYNKKNIDTGFKIGDKVEIVDGLHIGSTGKITGINRVRCFVDLGLKNPFYVKISQIKKVIQTPDLLEDTFEMMSDEDLENNFEKEAQKEMTDEIEEENDLEIETKDT